MAQAEILNTGLLVPRFRERFYQPIYGFSVYDPRTGEAYIVEVVEADLQTPDQLPNPTANANYDPFYIRVVFLNTMTCYNMSIIVPSAAYDQYGHLATLQSSYQNVLGKSNELDIGYMYSLYDSTHNFDTLEFSPYSASPLKLEIVLSESSPNQVFTNVPYSATQTVLFNPIHLLPLISQTSPANNDNVELDRVVLNPLPITFPPILIPPQYFLCRRKNWSADCHLMQSTNPTGKSIYMAYGGGDLVPMRLDAAFKVDRVLPQHASLFTHTQTDQQYDSAHACSVSNTPYFVGVSTQGGQVQYMTFSINATAGSAELSFGANQPLTFPTQCYVVGQASTTLTTVTDISSTLTDTGNFVN